MSLYIKGTIGTDAEHRTERLWPAEMCAFKLQVNSSGDGYRVSHAAFFPGSPVALGGLPASSIFSFTTGISGVDDPTLVEISDEFIPKITQS